LNNSLHTNRDGQLLEGWLSSDIDINIGTKPGLEDNLIQNLQLGKIAIELIERYPVVLQEFKKKVKFLRTTPSSDRNQHVYPHSV
jgi:hypothetical protein